jgi:predicted nuclease of predicted toxin-antitoxin system
MWLLDNNVLKVLAAILRQLSIQCATAGSQGWSELTNGELVEAASNASFKCILTLDKKFQESASRSLKKFPEMSIVLIVLPQAPATIYSENFRQSWQLKSILPVPGKLMVWP